MKHVLKSKKASLLIALLTCTMIVKSAEAATISTIKMPDGTDCKVGIKGLADFGVSNLSVNKKNTNPLTNRLETDSVTPYSFASASITGDFSNGVVDYGVALSVMANTYNNRAFTSEMYVKSNGFEVSLGHGHSAAVKFGIDGLPTSIGASCTAFFYGADVPKAMVFIDGLSLLSSRERPGVERARNITVSYTGQLAAESTVKFAVSYIPTDASVGSKSFNELEFRKTPYLGFLHMENKNVLTGALNFTQKFDVAEFGAAITFERAGDTLIYRQFKDSFITPAATENTAVGIEKYSSIGGGVSMKLENFGLAMGGQYLGDSFSFKSLKAHNVGKAHSMFFGISANYNDFAIAFKYGTTKNVYHNQFNSYSISAQYQLTGATFYATLEKYDYNSKIRLALEDMSEKYLVTEANDATKKKTNATADEIANATKASFNFTEQSATNAAGQVKIDKTDSINSGVIFAVGAKFVF